MISKFHFFHFFTQGETMFSHSQFKKWFTTLCIWSVCLGGCTESDPVTGTLNVVIDVEDLIVDGLPSGDNPGQIADGWSM